MPDPQPGDLDEGSLQPRISGLRDAMFAIDLATLLRCWCQAGISDHLPTIIKVTRQAVCPEDRGGFFTDTLPAKPQLRS